jgi:excisionase family DNA binding protein
VDLRGAARLLGVHYQTAYQWVREGTLPAVKVGSTYTVEEADVRRLADQRSRPLPPQRKARVRSWSSQVERFTALLVEGDEPGVRLTIDRLVKGGTTPLELLEGLVAPALRSIGSAWETGALGVAEEHRATGICDRVVGHLTVRPRGRPRGVCVVATPAGEAHGLPAAMAAVALRSDRWQVHHLGADVPVEDLVRFGRSVEANLVVLSVASEDMARRAAEVATPALASAGLRTLVGRPGASLNELLTRAREASGTE